MVYALWELRTNNLIRDFDHEHDALAATLRFIELNGPASVDYLSPTVEDDQDEGGLIAYGSDLAERARREFATKRVAG